MPSPDQIRQADRERDHLLAVNRPVPGARPVPVSRAPMVLASIHQIAKRGHEEVGCDAPGWCGYCEILALTTGA